MIRALPPADPRWSDGAGVVVVGTGAAGLSAALEAAAGGADVLVVSKAGLGGGSTPWAQGGLAAALDRGDSPAAHAADTVAAGAGLCDPAAVDALTAAAPGEIRRLAGLGARFDGGPLGLEGGHSRHRVVHAGGDASGAEVHRVLAAAVGGAAATGRLRLVEHTVALDLLLDHGGRVAGLLAGRVTAGSLEVGLIRTAAVVLATGGFGQAYATTTNPPGVTGDGLALAVRAGAEVSGVEFVQFHPTVMWLAAGRGRRPLVTEALRGAGAVLVDDSGRPVMAGVHPRADLAPRDVVSAAMADRMARSGASHLWLDATGVPWLEEEFPTVTAACRAAGFEPTAEPIPVAPGAHYACGGVRAGMDGTTSVDGLFAVGEVAATGVHGANRLASNSITEGMVAGRRAGRAAAGAAAPPAAVGGLPAPGAGVDPSARERLADAMSALAGVVRHGPGLEHLAGLLAAAPRAPGRLDLETVEATNLHTASTLVAAAATARTESRGCHRRSDFPLTDSTWQHDLILRWTGGRLDVGTRVDA